MSHIGILVHLIGELMIAFTVLRVHRQVVRDQKLDKSVLHEMKLEQRVGFVGVAFILVGACIEIISVL